MLSADLAFSGLIEITRLLLNHSCKVLCDFASEKDATQINVLERTIPDI